MRASWTGFFAIASIAGASAFGACSSESNQGSPTGATATVNGVGVGPDSPCQGGTPNGQCVMFGGNAESCECSDCQDNAACNMRCNDDKNCQFNEDGTAEDCSCADCYGVHPNCTGTVDEICNDNSDEDQGIPNTCTAADACVCGECASDPKCGCNNDGLCQVFAEKCSCADCATAEQCGGPGPTSSSAGPGGGGGAGGVGGGMGGGPGGMGGMGGAPAGPGGGGMGGAGGN